MADYNVSSIEQKLEDFYFRSYADRDAWEDYTRVVGGLLALHGKNLDPDHVEAFEYGDCFKVQQACQTKNQSLLQFLLDVHNDRTFFQVLTDLHGDVLDTYGKNLCPEQKAVVESGDARLISAALTKENNNTPPPYPIVVWTIGYTDASGSMVLPDAAQPSADSSPQQPPNQP